MEKKSVSTEVSSICFFGMRPFLEQKCGSIQSLNTLSGNTLMSKAGQEKWTRWVWSDDTGSGSKIVTSLWNIRKLATSQSQCAQWSSFIGRGLQNCSDKQKWIKLSYFLAFGIWKKMQYVVYVHSRYSLQKTHISTKNH